MRSKRLSRWSKARARLEQDFGAVEQDFRAAERDLLRVDQDATSLEQRLSRSEHDAAGLEQAFFVVEQARIRVEQHFFVVEQAACLSWCCSWANTAVRGCQAAWLRVLCCESYAQVADGLGTSAAGTGCGCGAGAGFPDRLRRRSAYSCRLAARSPLRMAARPARFRSRICW